MQPQKDSSSPPKRKRRGPVDFLFYFLFTPDTWRILIGTVSAVILTPWLLPVDRTGMGRYVLFIMIVVVGWAITGVPGRWIAQRLQNLIKPS
ncbi:MAG: hypothetical protein JJV98_20240 [Desulfosarcina sp.]|nr:hypothetical protein [Desulfobacterales bacterium]